MSEIKIKYLEHPVAVDEKKKWTEKGFKIIDKVFEPEKAAKGSVRGDAVDQGSEQ